MLHPSRRTFLAGVACCCVPTIAAGQSPAHLSVGTARIDSGMTPIIAQRAGFCRRQGLDIDIQFMNSGAAVAAAVVGGALQIGSSSMLGLITAHAKGIPFQIIAPAAVYVSAKPATLLIVSKNSPIHTGADLNGKTIASPALHDLLSTSIFAWIDQNGGDSKTVRQVELPQVATPPALEAGRIDAAAISEPLLSDTLNAGNVRVLGKPYDAIAARFLESAYFALPDVINANRNAVERLARAFHDANAFANAHPDQTAPWLAEVAQLDLTAVLRGSRASFEEILNVPSLQRLIDTTARYKVIDRSFDARDLISPVVQSLRFT